MTAVGVAIWLLLALPWVRDPLERVMATHMLLQIPLLAVAGGLIAAGMPVSWRARVSEWNRGGITGILLALLVSTWWMVPRALDLVLVSPVMELAKFVTLPLCVGMPVALSWRALGGIGRGFVIANVLPMWAVVGWLYLAAPVRVCNYYLVSQQVVAGGALLVASCVAGAAMCALAFVPSHSQEALP